VNHVQIEVIMPAIPAPRVTSPSPAPSSSSNSAKSGTFASILEEEQAAKAPVKETAAAEEPETDDDADDDAGEATDEAATAVAALVGAEVAANATPTQPVTVAAAPAAAEGEDNAVEGVEAATAPVATLAKDSENAPAPLVEGSESVPVAPEAKPEAQKAEAVEVKAKTDAVTTEEVAMPVAEKSEAAQATSTPSDPKDKAPDETKPAPVEAKAPAEQTEQPAAKVAQDASKPKATDAELVTAANDTRVTMAVTTPTDKDSEESSAAPVKAAASGVKGAQPATTEQPANGTEAAKTVTAPEATSNTSFRDALAARSAQPEAKSVDKPVEQPETAPTDTRHATTAVAHTEAPKQAAQTEAVAAAQSASNAAPAAQDPAEVALKSIRHMTLHGDKQLTVKLKPESLGEMSIAITANKDGGLEVQLSATQSGTREVLEKQLVNLRDSLSREGIVVNKVSVAADLSGQQQFQQSGSRQAGADSGSSRSFSYPGNSPYRQATPSTMSAPRTAARHRGSLDLYA
jgi:flagellar hook-length control protein FliK